MSEPITATSYDIWYWQNTSADCRKSGLWARWGQTQTLEAAGGVVAALAIGGLFAYLEQLPANPQHTTHIR